MEIHSHDKTSRSMTERDEDSDIDGNHSTFDIIVLIAYFNSQKNHLWTLMIQKIKLLICNNIGRTILETYIIMHLNDDANDIVSQCAHSL